jgi:2-alkyl-3-oxoalkanoate reductase
MRIAVTGASGFVGGAVARRLAGAGHEVTGLGRRITPPDGLATYQAFDLVSGAAAPKGLREAELVVHAAAHVADTADDRPFRAVTVEGTARILSAMAPDARLIVIGSASVYDPRRAQAPAREEEAPVANRRYFNAYARAKADQERLVAERRPEGIVLRPRGVWGPGDRTLLPRLLARVRGGRLLLPDGGRARGSMTHIDTLTAVVLELIGRPGIAGPLNVADATPIAPADLLELLAVRLGWQLRVAAIPGALAEVAAIALGASRSIRGAAGEPLMSRYAVAGIRRPVILDLARLHGTLGFAPDVHVPGAVAELVP